MISKIFLFLAIFASNNFVHADEPQVDVLVILPLTGDLAQIGNAVRNGMEMAIKKTTHLNVLFEDDGGQPKNTVSALKKNLALKTPKIVITASSGTSKAIVPILEEMKIPLFAIATDDQISQGKKFAMNFWATPDDEARELVQEAMRRGYKSIAVFSTVHEGTMSILRKFNEANQNQLKVVYSEEFPLEIKDFRSIITRFKAKNLKVDGIFANVFFGQVGLFAKQLRQFGVTQPLFAIELFEDTNEVELSGGALVDQWYLQADDTNGDFLERYSKLYPNQSSFGAANGYDSIMLIEKAASENNLDSVKINNFLHEVKNYHGELGVFSAGPDNRYSLPVAVKVVKKDGFEKILK